VTHRDQPHDEQGQTTLLIVGLAVVLLMAVAVVVDASAAFLQRQGLDSIADGAALAAADAGAQGEEVYAGGLDDGHLQLVADAARTGVDDYLAAIDARRRYPGLRARVSVDESAGTVTVRLVAPLDLPLRVPGSPGRARIGASASAVVEPLR